MTAVSATPAASRPIVRPGALAATLLPIPVSPTGLADLLHGVDGAGAFRALVRLALPDEEDAIMGAGAALGPVGREMARVSAFVERFAARRFPIYEPAEYREVLANIPVAPQGWSLDELHDVACLRLGPALLLALAEDVFLFDGYRAALLDELLARGMPDDLLAPLAADGLAEDPLRARLADTPYAAAADFCAWVHHDTGNAFLDVAPDDEYDSDCPWTRAAIITLTREWRRARALIERVTALCGRLERAPAREFAALLAAAGMLDQDEQLGGPEGGRDDE